MRRYVPGRALSRGHLLGDCLRNAHNESQTVATAARVAWPALHARCHILRAIHTTQPLIPPANSLNAHAGPSQSASHVIEPRDSVAARKQLEAILVDSFRVTSSESGSVRRSATSTKDIEKLLKLFCELLGQTVTKTYSLDLLATPLLEESPSLGALLACAPGISRCLSTYLHALRPGHVPPELRTQLELVARVCYQLSFRLERHRGPTGVVPPSAGQTSTSVLSPKAAARESIELGTDARRGYVGLLTHLLAKESSSGSNTEVHRDEADLKNLESVAHSLERLFESLGQDKTFRKVFKSPAMATKVHRSKQTSPRSQDYSPTGLLALWLRLQYEIAQRHHHRRGTVAEVTRSGGGHVRLPEAVLDLGLVDASNLTDGALASSAIWRQSRAHVEGGESLTSTPASEDFGSFVRDTVLEGLTRSLPRLEKAVSRMNVRDDAGRDALSIVWSSVYAKMKVVREDKGKGREDRGNINESDGMGWLYEPDGQVAALKVFLHSFLQALSYDTVSGQAVTTSRKAQVSTNLNGLLSLLPSPTPLPICQTLLSHYARSDAVEFGNTSRSSLAALRATWERMREEGVKKDAKTYMMYMEGLGRKGDFEGLKEAWEELRVDEACRQSWEQEEKAKLGASSCSSIPPYPPISTFNMFISHLLLLPEGQGTDLALSLFEYLASPNNPYEPDMVTVNTVLRHYAKQKDTAGMLDLLQRLPAIGPSLKPDVVTYTTVIGGLLDAGQRDAARSLIDVMQNEGIEPNLHTYSLLIADLARTGQRQQIMAAEELMRKLPEQGMKPTEVTWTSLIGGYFKGGYVADAWRTLATLRATGVALNRVTYNMILRWCAGMPSNEHLDGPTVRYINKALGIGAGGGGQRRLRGHVCLDVLEAMRAAHVQPNEDSWFIVLDGLARAQRWDEAREVMDEMRRRRFVVSPDSALGRVVRRIRSSL